MIDSLQLQHPTPIATSTPAEALLAITELTAGGCNALTPQLAPDASLTGPCPAATASPPGSGFHVTSRPSRLDSADRSREAFDVFTGNDPTVASWHLEFRWYYQPASQDLTKLIEQTELPDGTILIKPAGPVIQPGPGSQPPTSNSATSVATSVFRTIPTTCTGPPTCATATSSTTTPLGHSLSHGEGKYFIVAGDYPLKIAVMFGCDWSVIATYNGLNPDPTTGDFPRPGAALRIPATCPGAIGTNARTPISTTSATTDTARTPSP